MNILVAEDDKITGALLRSLLKKWGYDYSFFSDGREAWEALQENQFNLALLDWMLPGIDGISLVKKVRSAQNLEHKYIILITSKDKNDDIVRGLDAGADDYVLKPFHPKELKSRLQVGTRLIEYENLLVKQNRELGERNKEMTALVEQRTKQLLHAEKMSLLGILSAGIAHEINNPTTFISGNIQTLKQFWDEIKKNIGLNLNNVPESAHKLKFAVEKMPELIEGIHAGVARISRIVNGLRVFSRKDKGEMSAFDVNKCVEEALKLCHNKLKSNIKVLKETQDDIPEIYGSMGQIEQVLVNLFINAADAMENIEEGILKIEIRKENGNIIICVEDNGPGIPEENLDSIWQPFFTSKPEGKGTGLGLSISLNIIEAHNGKIKSENVQNGGVKFTLKLPCEQAIN